MGRPSGAICNDTVKITYGRSVLPLQIPSQLPDGTIVHFGLVEVFTLVHSFELGCTFSFGKTTVVNWMLHFL